MTNVIHGEVPWGEVNTEGPAKADGRDTFLRLEKGSNIVRIVTAPHQYTSHRYKKEGDPGFGHKIMCSVMHGSCPLCALGDKPKRRWLLGVIDRRTKSYKILDIGIAVFKSIQTLTRDDEWGEPSKYDLDIKMDPNGGAQNYYAVMPKIPRPLNAEDIQIKDMVDAEELKRRTLPPEPDKVQDRLDKIFSGAYQQGGGNKNAGAPPAPRTAKAAPKPAVNMSDDDEDNDEPVQFPNYQQKMTS